MQQCFVIQPFDGEKFDKRYKDVFEPAIQEAGLTPYRVDQDPSTQGIMKAILKGITRSSVCLVEISTDNPNVWFELGYSIAKGRGVVLLCSNEREGPYPFDVSHLAIIKYSTDSPSDFDAVRRKISEKLKALVASSKHADSEQIDIDAPESQVLSADEITAICGIADIVTDPWTPIFAHDISRNIHGISGALLMMSLENLTARSFIERCKIPNPHDGEMVEGVRITSKGWRFLRENKSKPEITKHIDDIPF